ncbi:MAG: pilus assembly protein PilM [Lachnospiraceae bacterium]|nr:pilus assembly protein PilM [Lachnospiraceae bacterium]
MANETINIQVGDRLTEVCRAVKRGREYEIKDYFTYQNPSETVSDGMIMDVERFSGALMDQLRTHGLAGSKQVVFTISSGRIASREVNLPAVKEQQIEQLVKTNSSEYFPVDMSQYTVSYVMLGKVPGDAGGWHISVKAAPNDLLKSYTQVADKLGLKIQAIDTIGNSVYQVLKKLKPQKLSMYLDVSTSRTVCTLLNGSEYILQRVFPYGGDELVVPFLEGSGRGPESYAVAMAELERGGEELIREDVAQEELDRFVTSAMRVNDFARSVKSIDVERVVLLGQCSNLPYFKRILSEKTGIPVEIFGTTDEVKKFTNSVGAASNYISCLGSLISPVDLVPANYGTKQKAAQSKGFSTNTAFIIMIGLIAVGVVLALTSFIGYMNAQTELLEAEAELASLEPAKVAHDEFLVYEANAGNLKLVVDEAQGKNMKLREFLNELEKKMPSSMLALSMSATNDGITLDITVNTLPEAADVINQFRTFESFEIISVSGVSEEADSVTGQTRQHFTLTASYPMFTEENPAENSNTSDTAEQGASQS